MWYGQQRLLVSRYNPALVVFLLLGGGEEERSTRVAFGRRIVKHGEHLIGVALFLTKRKLEKVPGVMLGHVGRLEGLRVVAHKPISIGLGHYICVAAAVNFTWNWLSGVSYVSNAADAVGCSIRIRCAASSFGSGGDGRSGGRDPF